MKKKMSVMGIIIGGTCMVLGISHLGVSLREDIEKTTEVVKDEEAVQGTILQEGEKTSLEIPVEAIYKVHLGDEVIGNANAKGKIIRLSNTKTIFKHQNFIEGEIRVESGQFISGETIVFN